MDPDKLMKLDLALLHMHRHFSRLWSSQERGALEFELTISEFDYLFTVALAEAYEGESDEKNDRSHLSSLAAEMQVQKSSASVMAKKLESRGLIHRVQCRYDSRAQHILLTDSGRTHLEQMQHQIYSRLADSFKEQLNTKDYQKFEALMERLITNLSAPNSDK